MAVSEGYDLSQHIGSLVKFYKNGWRHGYLDALKKGVAWIRPIAPHASERVRRVRVHPSDVVPTLE